MMLSIFKPALFKSLRFMMRAYTLIEPLMSIRRCTG